MTYFDINTSYKVFMNKFIIKDDMKKESIFWKQPMIIFFVLAILFPLAMIWNPLKTRDIILGEVFFAFVAFYFLYAYLYCLKYQIVVYDEKIILRTLLKEIEVGFSDINKYSYKRYQKTVFYQFDIFYNDKKISVNTRYKDELNKVLETAVNTDAKN